MPAAHCCICKGDVNFNTDANGIGLNDTGHDPCALILVSNVAGPRSEQREQQFYCHMECFRKLVNDDSILYLLEPDFETIGELEKSVGP